MAKKRIFISTLIVVAIALLIVTSFCFADENSTYNSNTSLTELTGKEILINSLEDYVNNIDLDNVSNSSIKIIIKYKDVNKHDIISDLAKNNIDAVERYSYDNIFNGVSIEISAKDILSLTKLSYIESVSICNQYEVLSNYYSLASNTNEGVFTNNTSYNGESMSIAVLDNAFDTSHSAFSNIESGTYSITKNYINSVLYSLNSYKESGATASQLYLSDKIAYAYDYAELDTDVYLEGADHGTHVAGIIGGNNEEFSGVLKNVQLALMKVGDDKGAIYSDVLITALEDCLALNVDAVNMSLGSSAGFSIDNDELTMEVLNKLEEAGITVVCAAGNDFTSSYNGESGDLANIENIDNGVVGSPASYKTTYSTGNATESYLMDCNGNKIIASDAYYLKSLEYGNYFEDYLTYIQDNGVENGLIEYIILKNDSELALGKIQDYDGINVAGKIVVVSRGEISFGEKCANAAEKGAIGIIIVNNSDSLVSMSIENEKTIPCCLITQKSGNILQNNANSENVGSLIFNKNDKQSLMADSSSRGVLEDLSMGVDFVAYGTNVYSLGLDQTYENMTGTSMASPNAAAVMTLVKQYVKANAESLCIEPNDKKAVAECAAKLIMSNTTILKDINNVSYSPRAQGAGLINIDSAISNKTTIAGVDNGIVCEKSKIELGDKLAQDKTIQFTFRVSNLDDSEKSYSISVELLTELIENETILSGLDKVLDSNIKEVRASKENVLSTIDDVYYVKVASHDYVDVTITLEIAKNSIEYLNKFQNGIYLEGYVYLNTNTTTSSCPILGFYGDWESASMLDSTFYEEAEGDTAAVRPSTSYGIYAGAYYVPMGQFAYKIDDENVEAPLASQEYAALSIYSSAMYELGYVQLGLLRNAQYLTMELIDNSTGEVIWTDESSYIRKTVYYSSYGLYGGDLFLDISPYSMGLENNKNYSLKISIYRTYNEDEENVVSDEYEQSFYVDYEQPQITNISYSFDRRTAHLSLYDNHYLQALLICTSNAASASTVSLNVQEIIPMASIQGDKGKTVTIDVDISRYSGTVYYYLVDYAFNYAVYYDSSSSSNWDNMFGGDTAGSSTPNTTTDLSTKTFKFKVDSVDASINKEVNLSSSEYLSGYNLQENNTWTSSNPKVAVVNDGKMTGLSEGVCVITVENENGVSSSIVVKINSNEILDNVSYEDTIVSGYSVENIIYGSDLVFGLNVDKGTIELAPNEAFSFKFDYLPYNYNYIQDPINIEVVSDNETVVSVSENKVITAKNNGNANITVKANNEVIKEYSVNVCESIYINENGILQACFNNSKDLDLSSYSFKAIAKNAFTYALNLETIKLPATCKTIAVNAFKNNTSLQKIDLGGVNKIDSNAFEGCVALTEIDLSNVSNVGENALKGCVNLSKVVLSSSQLNNMNISSSTFAGCNKLTVFTIDSEDKTSIVIDNRLIITLDFEKALAEEAIESLGTDSMSNVKNKVLDLSNTNIKRIEKGAFESNSNIEEIILPSSVEYIGKEAFNNCVNLKTVVFNSNTIEIGDRAFANTKLSTVDLGGCNVTLGDEAFYNCADLLYANLGIVKGIGKYTFAKSSNLYYVEFEQGTQEIGAYTFSLYIENNTQYDHAALKYVVIPSSVNIINEYAFAYCANIDYSKADFSNVEEIGMAAFYGCGRVKQLSFPKVKTIGYGAFAESDIVSVKLGTGLGTEDYLAVGEFAFYKCDKLESVELSNSALTSIEMASFYSATSLSKINLDKVEYVGEYAFANDSSLSKLTLSSVYEIDRFAFAGCSSLVSLSAQNIEYIGEYAFANSSLEKFVMPASIKFINQAAFAGTVNFSIERDDSNYENIVFDELLDGSLVVYSKLENGTYMLLYYPVNASESYYAIMDNTSIIGAYAFMNAKNLTNVSMQNITYIGTGAFYKCESLNSITVVGSVPTLLTNTSGVGSNELYFNFVDFASDDIDLILYTDKNNLQEFKNSHMYSNYFSTIIAVDEVSDYSKVSEVIRLIDDIDISKANKDSLKEIVDLYNSLSDEEKNLLDTNQQLKSVSMKYMQIKRVYAVESITGDDTNLISSIVNNGESWYNLPTWAIILLTMMLSVIILAATVLVTWYCAHKVMTGEGFKKKNKEGKKENKSLKEIFGEKNDDQNK